MLPWPSQVDRRFLLQARDDLDRVPCDERRVLEGERLLQGPGDDDLLGLLERREARIVGFRHELSVIR
jgi:hypothetical protein